MGSYIDKEDIPEVAKFIGMGYYRVKESGEFLEANEMARKIFGIPKDEKDLSKHSIENLYIFPAERKPRLQKLRKTQGKPISSTLSLRVNGENKLLFDQCWYDDSEEKGTCVAGLVANIEDRIIFSKMFKELPMGVYEVDNDNKFVRWNKKFLEILGHNPEKDLLGKSIEEFYENPDDLKRFSEKVGENGHAHEILKFKNAAKKIIELECFSAHINEFNIARRGMLNDVTKRERYYRALDRMPTGYYYIEHDKKGKHRYQGHIVQCNAQFARILGVENEDDLIGEDVRKYHVSKEEGEKYFKRLDEAGEKDEPLLDYSFRLKRADNGKIVHISVDSQLVKEKGRIIGREGTIRDITEKVRLQEKVTETEERLKKMTADINNLIHTFLHPVLKFSGHAELFHQLGKILFKSIRYKAPGKTNIHELGEELENKLEDIKEGLKYISDMSESAAVLEPKFEKIINIFDYNLDKAKGSKILKDKAIRDAALWVLEELERIEFFDDNFKKGEIEGMINDEFIEYLQNILFDYLIRTVHILKGETHMMRREVEALRRYIEVGQRRISHFEQENLKKILEENIELFEPVLAQKDIEVEYTPPKKLNAYISKIDIDRVICNLLHNAAKYSHRGPGRNVKIKTRDLYRENAVEFSITSYGIPIGKGEINSGDIFEFGYRGQFAIKANRDGTGMGLADAKDVIDQHGGEIKITSDMVKDKYHNPKRPKRHELPKYKIPHITTITIKLPKTRDKKGENDGTQSFENEKITMG
jgi:PAS domain S-box-containing protein